MKSRGYAVPCLFAILAASTGIFSQDTSPAPNGANVDGIPSETLSKAGSDLLGGAIDFHVHCLPDVQPRSIDSIDLAKLAKLRGMRGIVLKNHYEDTAAIAYLVRKQVPGIDVFGGIVLNRTVGGINPSAVENMIRLSGGFGKVVWFPTNDAEYAIRRSGQTRTPVPITQDGVLRPEVKQILSLVAKNHLVLETGHLSPNEIMMLIREAKAEGVEHILITHAAEQGMTVAQMQEAAGLGAYIEWVYNNILANPSNNRKARYSLPDYAKLIRQVGPEHSVLSTDLGQAGNPYPPDGLAAFLGAMAREGFSTQEIEEMAAVNPGKLLGL